MSERQLTDDAVKEQAIVLLAAGFSLRDVAKQVERSHTCVWKWMQSPEFVARVNAAADALAKTMQARMLSLGGMALETLVDVMTTEMAKDSDKIAAARLILDRVAPATTKHEVTAGTLTTEEIEAQLAKHGMRIVREGT
jgi:hypothetical protein